MDYSVELNQPITFFCCFPFLYEIQPRELYKDSCFLTVHKGLFINYCHEVLNLKIVVKLSFGNKIIFYHFNLHT